MGFSVVLNASINEYFCSSYRSFGFKFLLHSPTEFPRIADYGNLIRTNRETRVIVTPSYRNTAKTVRSLPVSDKNCLYNTESMLQNFQIYSSSNCELECVANEMEKKCGCIQFYIPRKSNQTKICGLKDIQCSIQVEKAIDDLSKANRKCMDCLWSCVYFTYKQIITHSHLLETAPILDEDLPEGYNVSEIAVLHFFYKHTFLHVTTMEAYLGFLEFFANSGGLYSLFLGFSILSLIEIFYFVAQMFAKILKRNRQKKGLILIVENWPYFQGNGNGGPTACNPIKFYRWLNFLGFILLPTFQRIWVRFGDTECRRQSALNGRALLPNLQSSVMIVSFVLFTRPDVVIAREAAFWIIDVNHQLNERQSDVGPSKNYRRILKDTFLQYLQTTTLHGLKFIGDRNISEPERLFFLLAFILSVLTSSYYISAIYMKWHLTPLLITTSSTSTSISSIPFPAITICNLNQAKKSLVGHLKPGVNQFAYLQTLCKNEKDVHVDSSNSTDDWEQFRKFIMDVSQPCAELLLSCRYGSVVKNCSSIFEPILTDDGLCCTFNNVHADYLFTDLSRDSTLFSGSYNDPVKPIKWTPEGGYQRNLPIEYYPRKAQGTGVNMGLTIVVNASINEYFCSSTRGVGFKMLMHNPTEMPKITNYGYLLSAGVETQVIIQPELHNAARNIRRIQAKSRHCLFADEIKLRFYQTYTKGNCELECESERLVDECGCVTYYLPRFSKDIEVCGLKDFNCIHKVQYESESLINETTSCARCIPGCVSLNYLPVITSTELLERDFAFRENYTKKDLNLEELAVIHFFYECNSFRARTKEEFLGFADFLANSGGILGLFLGFSMLSVIELLYFIFLVPQTIIKNYIQRKQRDSDQQVAPGTITQVQYSGSYSNSSLNSSSSVSNLGHFEGDYRTSYGYYAKPGAFGRSRYTRGHVETRTSSQLPYCE